MGMYMKKVFNAFIDRLSEESGYGYDFLVDRFNDMIDDPDWDGDVGQFIGITLERDW